MNKDNNPRLDTAVLRDILMKEAEAVQNIPVGPEVTEAIDLIVEQVHKKGGKVVTSGMGKAGQIAANIATTFSSTGTPAFFLHPSEAQHGDLGIVCPNDIMILISNSGKTREILELIDLSQHLVPGIAYICITGNPESKLAENASVALFTGAPKEVCPLGLTPTTSTTVMTVIGDLLVVGVMTAIGFDYESYSKRHHGGYLGDISRKKSNI